MVVLGDEIERPTGMLDGLGHIAQHQGVRGPVDGKVAALSLGEYKLPTVADMPRLRTVLLPTAIGPGPFGAKAAGEVTNSGVAPAIANAVADACGARVRTLPVTAERVLAALNGG
jgi:CO/xanthine dehydrogenase Mo-binding subunit